MYVRMIQDIKEIWDRITYIANHKYKYLIRKSFSFLNNTLDLGWVDIKQQRF